MLGQPRRDAWARGQVLPVPVGARCSAWDLTITPVMMSYDTWACVLIAQNGSFSMAKCHDDRRAILQHWSQPGNLGKPNFLTKNAKIIRTKPNFLCFHS